MFCFVWLFFGYCVLVFVGGLYECLVDMLVVYLVVGFRFVFDFGFVCVSVGFVGCLWVVLVVRLILACVGWVLD